MKSFPWLPSRDLTFTSNGKYQLDFDPDLPVRLEYRDFADTAKVTPSYHDFFEITFIYRGKGLFHVSGNSYPVSGGDVLIVNNTEFHRLENVSRRPLKAISVNFMPEWLYQPGERLANYDYVVAFYISREHLRNKLPINKNDSRRILELICRMEAEMEKKKPYYALSVRNCLAEILLLINRCTHRPSRKPAAFDQRRHDIRRLQTVFDYIKGHYTEKISNRQLGEAASMSPSYLCRFFRKVTGLTLTDYIVRYRIDQAKERLQTTDRSISQIAFETGFESHSYFDQVFRQLTRSTPKRFRYR